MRIWPAIDLRGGKCVRLQQGDYHRETVFSEDPAAMARHWLQHGAECFHLVDLDGAKSGKPENLESIRAILATADVPCELGGGIRSEDTIRQIIELGVQRLVIGTAAIKQPDWFARVCELFPGKLVLGIDARDGFVATDGWLETSRLAAVDVARQFEQLPLAGIVYTDISTDGMLSGPNVEAMAEMKRAVTLPVVASGGVATVEDVRRLSAVGMDGCIIGRALYEGKIALEQAVSIAKTRETPPG